MAPSIRFDVFFLIQSLGSTENPLAIGVKLSGYIGFILGRGLNRWNLRLDNKLTTRKHDTIAIGVGSLSRKH